MPFPPQLKRYVACAKTPSAELLELERIVLVLRDELSMRRKTLAALQRVGVAMVGLDPNSYDDRTAYLGFREQRIKAKQREAAKLREAARRETTEKSSKRKRR